MAHEFKNRPNQMTGIVHLIAERHAQRQSEWALNQDVLWHAWALSIEPDVLKAKVMDAYERVFSDMKQAA